MSFHDDAVSGVEYELPGGQPMLTTSLNFGQPLWIGPDIQIVIHREKDGRVLIGVEAPAELVVCRNGPPVETVAESEQGR